MQRNRLCPLVTFHLSATLLVFRMNMRCARAASRAIVCCTAQNEARQTETSALERSIDELRPPYPVPSRFGALF